MGNTPNDRYYSKEHLWIQPHGGRGRIGITDFAQSELGDILFVNLPAVGSELRADEVFGSIESAKTVSDLFAPASGRVLAVNERLSDEPELVNQDPYGEGWLLEIELTDPSELGRLLDAAGYEQAIAD